MWTRSCDAFYPKQYCRQLGDWSSTQALSSIQFHVAQKCSLQVYTQPLGVSSAKCLHLPIALSGVWAVPCFLKVREGLCLRWLPISFWQFVLLCKFLAHLVWKLVKSPPAILWVLRVWSQRLSFRKVQWCQAASPYHRRMTIYRYRCLAQQSISSACHFEDRAWRRGIGDLRKLAGLLSATLSWSSHILWVGRPYLHR